MNKMKPTREQMLAAILEEIMPDSSPRQPDEFTVADLAGDGDDSAVRRRLAKLVKQGEYTRRQHKNCFLYRKAKP